MAGKGKQMAARDLGPWTYTDDKGRDYVRRADKYLTGQTDTATPPNPLVGGASGSAVVPYESMPRNLRPRGLYCSGSGGYKAFVVIYDKATYEAALITPITINVRDAGGTPHSVTSFDGRGEKRGRVIGPGQ